MIKSDRLVESIEQAERAGLVRSIPGSTAGRFVFSHELVRQAVIGGLAAVRRQRLHLSLGRRSSLSMPAPSMTISRISLIITGAAATRGRP